jgi:hypothetical protein
MRQENAAFVGGQTGTFVRDIDATSDDSPDGVSQEVPELGSRGHGLRLPMLSSEVWR